MRLQAATFHAPRVRQSGESAAIVTNSPCFAVSSMPMNRNPEKKLCILCKEVRDDKQRNPVHVIHPTNSIAMLFDEGGEAVCPFCQALWRRDREVMSLVD